MQTTESIYSQFENWYKSNLRNIWLEDDVMKVYVRKSVHKTPEGAMKFIDVASIEVDESFRGKGFCKNFFHFLERKFPQENIFVESIQSKILIDMLLRRGFKEIPEQSIIDDNFLCTNMYKRGISVKS